MESSWTLSDWTFLLNFSLAWQFESDLVWFLYPHHNREVISSFAFLEASNMDKGIYVLDIARIISKASCIEHWTFCFYKAAHTMEWGGQTTSWWWNGTYLGLSLGSVSFNMPLVSKSVCWPRKWERASSNSLFLNSLTHTRSFPVLFRTWGLMVCSGVTWLTVQ